MPIQAKKPKKPSITLLCSITPSPFQTSKRAILVAVFSKLAWSPLNTMSISFASTSGGGKAATDGGPSLSVVGGGESQHPVEGAVEVVHLRVVVLASASQMRRDLRTGEPRNRQTRFDDVALHLQRHLRRPGLRRQRRVPLGGPFQRHGDTRKRGPHP